MPFYFFKTCAVLLQILFFLIGIYYLGIGIFSLFPLREKPAKKENLSFAVVIPAHNEEASLPGLLRSLKEQTYPQERFCVFVIADRCSDQTEEIARRFGATPILRKTFSTTGKGAALSDAFAQIQDTYPAFDAIAVLDADNLADPHFLESMNEALEQGFDAVQGYIDSKNPFESWVSHAYSVWYWISNRILQMGFFNLGVGCKLGGTGFALRRKLLLSIPFQTTTLSEDAEYTMRLSLSGQKIAYAPRAVVYDEKPTSLSASLPQRVRWTQGITEVQRDFAGRLLRQRKFSDFLRFWSDLLMPLTLFVFLVLDIFALLHLSDILRLDFVSFWVLPLPFFLLNLYILGMFFVISIGLLRDKKWNLGILLNFFGFFLYLVTWIPAGILGILKHRKKEWYHTKHKPSI